MAARLTLEHPTWWAWAMAGFLARGGIIVFAVPILALPTPIDVTNFFGADAITLEGPAPWVIVFGSAVTVIVAVAIVLGGLIGVLSDRVLVRAAVPTVTVPPAPLIRLLAIRLACLIPVITIAAGLTPRVAEAGYQEIILPDDFSMPFLLRVLLATRAEVVLIAAVWVASETFGGLAVRHAVLRGSGVLGSLGRAMQELVRHPVATLLLLVITLVGIIVTMIPAIVVIAIAWDVVGHVASSPEALAQVGAAAVLLVAVWLAAVAMVGLVAAWRSTSWSLEVARHLR